MKTCLAVKNAKVLNVSVMVPSPFLMINGVKPCDCTEPTSPKTNTAISADHDERAMDEKALIEEHRPNDRDVAQDRHLDSLENRRVVQGAVLVGWFLMRIFRCSFEFAVQQTYPLSRCPD